ncbi:MAG TPA: ATP-binding protein [Magnetospirillaceae bacterium]
MKPITQLKRLKQERDALEQRLIQVQKMETTSQLAGGLVHDFNNLLAIVVGQLDLVEEKTAGLPEIHEQIRACKRATEQTAQMTRGMLAFMRDQSLHPVVFRPDETVGDLLQLMGQFLGRGLRVEASHPRGLWTCEADPIQLQNALLNLALNARDAMPRGGRVLIATRNLHLDEAKAAALADAPPGDYVVVSLSDTGSGMTQEVLAKACEPFFTTKPAGKGSGLGLSMVRGFVQRSQGFMRIDTALGRGTTVELYLPRGSGPVKTRRRTAPHTKLPPVAANRESILVVDDDPDMREMLMLQLKKSGYAAFAAGSAAEALDSLRQRPEITIVFLDLVLPGEPDAKELTRQVARDMPHVKVVHMSGHPQQDAVDHAGLDPGTAILEKPFDREALLAAIKRARG